MSKPNHLERVVSGGQTGIDQLALEVARALGLPTGGVAPKGYLTEYGPDERLRDYGLEEHPTADYPAITWANIEQSDATLLLGAVTGRTRFTLLSCEWLNIPYLLNPTTRELHAWLIERQIRVLNVAGNRESQLTSEQRATYRAVMLDGLSGSRRLGVLYHPKPHPWGLRGDRYLWDDLAAVADTQLLPPTEAEFIDLLDLLIRNRLGEDLAPGRVTYVPRYAHGGMSSGQVSSDFWLKKALPLLRKRFREAIKHTT